MIHLAPPRGEAAPGKLWLYNNWDFNMAGHLFELQTGLDIYDDLEAQLALPLAMQDWDRSLQAKDGNRLVTDVLSYPMHFSTRDMARIGQLMLNEGVWNGKQLISKAWVRKMTSPISSADDLEQLAPFLKTDRGRQAYGYMWWLAAEPTNPMLEGAYTAQGAWGQNITIIPKLDVVVVIKTNDLYQRQRGDHYYILDEVASALDTGRRNDLLPLTELLLGADIDGFSEAFASEVPEAERGRYQDAINRLAYHYLNDAPDAKRAMQLFELNVAQFPTSWLAHDGLAEVYFMMGDYEESLTHYGRARSLNADNEYGYNEYLDDVIKRVKWKQAQR